MNEEETVRLAINGLIAELPESDQIKVKKCKDKILAILAEYGAMHGGLALSSIGADAAAGHAPFVSVGTEKCVS